MESTLRVISLKSPSLGSDIVDALLLDGFFLLVDHGVDTNKILQTTKSFFRDDKAKQSIPMKDFRGYSALGSEVTRYEDGMKKRDWHEGFDYVPETTKDPKWKGSNQFPNEDFKSEIESFYTACNRVGFVLMDAIARTLGVSQIIQGTPFSLLRLLHYPKPDSKAGVNDPDDLEIGIGIGEHTDYGFLTLVSSQEEGLQVRSRIDNSWLKVPILANDALVVNIGDSFSQMTRGMLRATPHRVLVEDERFSCAFFFEPDLDTIVSPIQGCKLIDEFVMSHPQVSSAQPSFRYGDFLYQKYAQSFP